jgi:hypothetical protein
VVRQAVLGAEQINPNEGTRKSQRGSDASPSAQPRLATPSFLSQLSLSFTPQPTPTGLCHYRQTARFGRAFVLYRLFAPRWQDKRLFLGTPDAATANGGTPMVANSLFLTIAILLALGFWLLGELKFFIPYKALLFHEYGNAILVYLTTLFLNLFAGAFALNRKFFLKDTGRKLSHLDKQLHVGQTEVRAPSLEEEVD